MRSGIFGAQHKIISSRVPGSVGEAFEILMENRGLDAVSISGELKDLSGYLSMRGMEEGALLMARHMARASKIVLVGDYDCDGITSVAQMALFLTEVGYSNFEAVIPLRREGYGIPERAVRENPDAGLFVAMDCGTLDRKPIALACSLGADCIVIDHHEVPPGEVAPASVIINPKHPECPSTFKEFCSAGLTLLFLAALRRALDGNFPSPPLGGKYMALAAIGTVADLVPLVSANRIIAGSGLRSINFHNWPPVVMLADAAGIRERAITAGHIGYYIGPRINAAGRVSDGRIAYELFTADKAPRMGDIARELNRLNSERQAEEESILKMIAERLAGRPPTTRTFVMADPAWSHGVVGIAASRVQQEFHYGPVIILAADKETSTARGSARSVPGFDIHAALQQCSDLLIKWGGHKAAAGLTIMTEKIPLFTERLEQIAMSCPAEIFTPLVKIDMLLPLELVCDELIEALRRLEPHGMGNPAPLFASRNTEFTLRKFFGKERKHLRLGFGNGLEGVFWRGAKWLPDMSPGEKGRLDIVFQVAWDDFYKKPSLVIKEMGRFLQ